MSYGWPLMPFDQQHPVRAFFGDPRIGKPLGGSSFHNGIDISAPDGTPVFAVAAGKVSLGGSFNVAVVSPDGVEHGYEHLQPAVKSGDQVAQGALIGHILMPAPGSDWQHVHFSECHPQGHYWNPLRQGALTPFAKTTAPSVTHIAVERGGQALNPNALSGLVDLIAEVHDITPIDPPPPWNNYPVTPAFVSWRLVAHATMVVPWRTAADFRTSLQLTTFVTTTPDPAYGIQVGASCDVGWEKVYAPGTRQNSLPPHPGAPPEPGHFRFGLAAGFDTTAHPDDSYRLDVQATDVHGNASTGHLVLVLANHSGQV